MSVLFFAITLWSPVAVFLVPKTVRHAKNKVMVLQKVSLIIGND